MYVCLMYVCVCVFECVCDIIADRLLRCANNDPFQKPSEFSKKNVCQNYFNWSPKLCLRCIFVLNRVILVGITSQKLVGSHFGKGRPVPPLPLRLALKQRSFKLRSDLLT